MNDLRRLISEKWLELLIAGICLHLFCAAVVIWLEGRPVVLLLIVLAIVFLLFALLGVRDLRKRRKDPTIGELMAFKLRRRGVILTLGPRSTDPNSVVFQVQKALKPEFFGFLGSPETDKAGVVDYLCQTLGLDETRFKAESWEPTRILEGATKTKLVIDWMIEQGLEKKDMVLDITGGKVTMSVAAFIASQDQQIDCEYIDSEFNREENQIIEGSQKPILIARYTDKSEA